MSQILDKRAGIGRYALDRARYARDASLLKNHALRFLWVLRRAQQSSNPLWKVLHAHMKSRYGLEIPISLSVEPGLYLGHAFNITINPNSIVGRNCNIHKGVTIGRENRGAREGAPILGDCVWIGVNATIVGSIVIGDDVLVAPNAFVNCDVPSHSIVLGNPCSIIPRNNATEGYINNPV